jgi:hypothetical protein
MAALPPARRSTAGHAADRARAQLVDRAIQPLLCQIQVDQTDGGCQQADPEVVGHCSDLLKFGDSTGRAVQSLEHRRADGLLWHKNGGGEDVAPAFVRLADARTIQRDIADADRRGPHQQMPVLMEKREGAPV